MSSSLMVRRCCKLMSRATACRGALFLRGTASSSLEVEKPSRKDTVSQKMKILKTKFGMPQSVVRQMGRTKKLSDITEHHLCELANTLNAINLAPQDIQDCQEVFKMPITTVKRYVEFLKDLEIEEINGKMITGFSKLVTKPCKLVKAYLKVPENASFVETMVGSLPAELQTGLRTSLSSANETEASFQAVWSQVIREYLKEKLSLGESKVQNFVDGFCLSEFPLTPRQLETAINHLLHYGFTVEEIITESQLLLSDPKAIVDVLDRNPAVTSQDTLGFLKEHPTVLSMNPEFVSRNLETLDEMKVPLEVIRNYVDILNEIPKVVKDKLEKMRDVPGCEAFFHNPQFLKRLKYLDQFEHRAKALMSVDPRHISLSVLSTCTEKRFEEIIHCGKQFRIPVEVLLYLAHHTNSTKDDIQKQLHSYLSWQQINLPNAVQVIEYLEQQGCTPEQIFHGLFLVLYPFRLVEKTFLRVPQLYSTLYPSVSNTKNPTLLKIAHYYLEKDYSFSGDGVYSSGENPLKDVDHVSFMKN